MRATDKALYDQTSLECSRLITEQYSTSFGGGIRVFSKQVRQPIYAIYGFVRFADEIVDTFHEHDKAKLMADFKRQTFEAIETGLSLNPVLHAFQLTVNQYGITSDLILAFFASMETDLDKKTFTEEEYKTYIYGSAEVVGLMCLHVFVGGDEQQYQLLAGTARALGSAFQKLNFLRDIKADLEERGRVYFPGLDIHEFDDANKNMIEGDIQQDFDNAYTGIRQLPSSARSGVMLAYNYYLQLFSKIKATPAAILLQQRVRVADSVKRGIFVKAMLKQTFGTN